MKRSTSITYATAILSFSLLGNVRGETLPPGEVDFGKFDPPRSGQFVEVNLTESLIGIAARFVGTNEPAVTQLLDGLKSVRVTVIGLDDENRADLQKRVEKTRKELETKGWERVVTTRNQDQDIGIYLKTHGKDTVQGLAVMAIDGDSQAVFVNVVGEIKPAQLSLLGEKLHIDPLKNIGRAAEK